MTDQNEEVAEIIGSTKYFQKGENLREATNRVADTLKDSDEHFQTIQDILGDQRFLPAGRIMVAVGAARRTTPYNCFVSGTIEDSMDSIEQRLGQSLQTMRLGGGIGYDFSNLRPSGFRIRSLDSNSCGPVGDDRNDKGFMDLFDAGCSVIRSAGHRRGAQMGVLRVDHPDIRHFIRAKRAAGRLTNFNVSVAVTDKFIEAVKEDDTFDLMFEGEVIETVDARSLWNDIMRLTWDYAEPGVLFIDRINWKNNLWYIEDIRATNPCAEQPLPPFGACLLGSYNLTKYIKWVPDHITEDFRFEFDYDAFIADIPPMVRAMDNVVDRAIYPLPEQEVEAKSKRRMGLGITGLADVAAILGMPYGSPEMKEFTREVLTTLRDEAYRSSVALAKEKGIFPAYTDQYLESNFVKTLPQDIQTEIAKYGIRNSHLLSVAPTGTISLFAGNVSSGIEPVFTTGVYERNVYLPDGTLAKYDVIDWAEKHYGVTHKTSSECSVDDHIDILNIASTLVDSSVSKTSNVGEDVSFTDFKEIYMKVYDGGASGCTTFRPSAIRGSVLSTKEKREEEATACYIDEQGNRTCE